ncbi:hotdog fold thioesterase [Ginsengibacter hankyongi]|uniref:Hotdog fold thioesterase n=1 Tax=Ginsengibacter hankyongi TaxID=2607284 RepID=A0A5J5ID92_9BACT|nr:hotdog fold thioesterase [Ginsengibacter hankyongi]KAA9037727.1 hotdog fold thioesterase [Ginsengibacter hankyongi]
MSIWFDKTISLEKIKDFGRDSMAGFLGMEWTAIGDDYLQISMPVNERTKQPYGIMHGGASCSLAETLGSVASALVIDLDKFYCVGMEINANHLRSVTHGLVTGKSTPLHLGKTTHVWDIKIYDESQNLVCVSRLTVAIIPNNRFVQHTKM